MNELLVAVRSLDGSKGIQALATVSIPTPYGMLTIHQIRVVRPTNGEGDPWVAYPQISFTKDGQTQYRDIMEVPWPMKREIQERIFAELSK